MSLSIQYNYIIADRYTAAMAKMRAAGARFDSGVSRIKTNLGGLQGKFKTSRFSSDRFKASIRSLSESSAGAQEKIKNFGQNLMRSFGTAVKVGIVGSLAAGVFAIKGFISEASKIEDATAAFTPLMGGAQRAQELVDSLNKTASTTPFQFENISAAAKQLLPVMDQDIEKTVETFRMLGDTAGGNAQKLDSITRGYTKAMLKGKVDMESLNMIAEAGVPIYSELAESMGVSVKEMMAMSSAGTITSQDLTNAFGNMTGEGGIFFKGMEIASATLSGKMSTLKDNIALTQAAIGAQLMPTLKPLVDKMILAAQNVKAWVEANQELINEKLVSFLTTAKNVTFGFFKVISTIVKVLKFLSPILIPIVAAIAAYQAVMYAAAAATLVYNAAQMVMNAVMTANPIGLVIAGIAALIAIIVIVVKYWKQITAAIKSAWTWMVNFYDSIKGLIVIFAPFLIPLLTTIEVIRNLVTSFAEIKAAFTDQGFIAGILALGKAIFTGLIEPFKSVLDLIIAVKDKIGGAFGAVKDFFTGGEDTESTSPYASRSPEAPSPGNMRGAQANANASVSVYTEEGMGVKPFTASGNLGYNQMYSGSM